MNLVEAPIGSNKGKEYNDVGKGTNPDEFVYEDFDQGLGHQNELNWLIQYSK